MLGDLIFGTVGFTISGCLARTDRLRHLLMVAFAVWLTGLTNVAFELATVQQWLFGAIGILLMMGLGYAISLAFVRPHRPEVTGGDQKSFPRDS